MPIQFRCPACDRMLGIARRKAGTVVKCPRCAAEVRVPALAGMAVESSGPIGAAQAIPKASTGTANGKRATRGKSPSPAVPKNVDSLPLFERPDFESLLNPAIESSKPAPEEDAPPPMTRLPRQPMIEDAIDVEVMTEALMLSRSQLTLAAVVIAVLMGFAFAAGYLLAGTGGPKEKPAVNSRTG